MKFNLLKTFLKRLKIIKVRNAFPENVIQSTLEHQQTVYEPPTALVEAGNDRKLVYRPKVVYKDGMNIIGFFN